MIWRHQHCASSPTTSPLSPLRLQRAAPGTHPESAVPDTAHILIVDDHRELADNVVELLKDSLFAFRPVCEITRSAHEALKITSESPFELCLLDVHLPDASGLELLRSLRQRSPFMQVVVLTGDATVQSAIRALEEGAFGYLLKPFQSTQLVEVASRAIERSKLLQEREGLRQDLERSERRHREVIDGVPAFVLALDEAGKIVVWNQQLERVTGYQRREMLGTDGRRFTSTPEQNTRLPLKGNGHRSVRWRLAQVAGTPGTSLVTYALGVDVTEESEMQRRTLRAERLAAVGTLAAGLAHEVRNPLNSATLQLQLLERKIARQKLDPSALSRVVAVVRSEIDRLDRLVNDFLAFAKPKPLQTTPSDLNQLVANVVDLLTVEAHDANVALLLQLEPNLGPVPLEAQSMRQVVLNLLRNSLEALRGQGGGQVRLCTRPVAGEASVALEVTDTGPGFSEDAPIFDAFYTTKDAGTGLGLAIVHRIVTEHGGTIGVHTGDGQTSFTVTLPQPAVPSARDSSPATSQQRGASDSRR